jgi:hypothetical protein
MRTTFFILFAFAALLACFTPPAHAQYSAAPYLQCFGASSGAATTTTCTAAFPNTCVSAGDLEFVIPNNYGNGTAITQSFSDNVDGSWSVGPNAGSQFYRQYGFYMIATTSACRTFTLTTSPGSTAILNDFSVWAVHGNFATLGGVLDCSSGVTFTSAGVSPRLTGNCVTTFTNDLFVGGIACNSTNTSEFSSSSGWSNLNGSHVSTSFRVDYKVLSAAGTFQGSFMDGFAGPCVFSGGVYGVQTVMAFKSATGGSGAPTPRPWIIMGENKKSIPDSGLALAMLIPFWRRPRRILLKDFETDL